ncbi:NAD-dependent succinate-semialdehyde dehydrogenase [Dactylosporangium sp. NPDC005572]|uniref:NAD-dependent succinate-semialdehyde dehydrogenase n=1 Tax=Dactylosporangium sp. NPDC005572 TaxID=3156889 RepID=UPI0033A33C8F
MSLPTELLERPHLYIKGAWVPAASGRPGIDVDDPSTGTRLGGVADAGPADAIRAVDAAADALPAWSATSPRERAEILRECFAVMMRNRDTLAGLMRAENGKTLADALGEVDYAAEFFRWFSEEAVRIGGDLRLAPSGANRILVQQQPVGVSLLITPWNFPAAMATRKLAPALAAGCTTVLKPSELTPLTAYLVAELMTEAGVPPGVVNVITSTENPVVVAGMLHDPRVRKLSFTGSTAVGRLLLAQAADQIVSCSMELGGNAPFIVLPDADVEQAVDGLMVAKMRNGGQACTAANRVYAHAAVRDRVVAELSRRMGELVVGTTCAPVITAAARDRIVSLVGGAVRGGASVVTGGRSADRPGWYVEPTVVDATPPGSEMMRTEIFGPVAAVAAFTDVDEVVAAANATPYGLAAYVYTGDLRAGLALADRIEAGMVAVNRGLVSDPAAPFGGVKQSGLGREGGRHGIEEFLETKYVAVAW